MPLQILLRLSRSTSVEAKSELLILNCLRLLCYNCIRDSVSGASYTHAPNNSLASLPPYVERTPPGVPGKSTPIANRYITKLD